MKPLLFLVLLSLFGNNPSESRITYRQLTWEDFRSPVSESEPSVAARSFTQLAMEIKSSGNRCHFAVKAYFLPDSSFVRLKAPNVLDHEQTHFKIAYIEAQKCMRALEPMQGGDSLDQVMALTLFDHFFDDCSRMQDLFDLESRHGNNPQGEKRWEDKISREIRTFGTSLKTAHGRNR